MTDLAKLKQYMGAYFQEPKDEVTLLSYLDTYTSPALCAHHLWLELPAYINVGSVKSHITGNEQTVFQSFKDVLDFCRAQAQRYLLLYNSEKKYASGLSVLVERSQW